jgi:CrcB protein
VTALSVAVGGAVGAAARFLVGVWARRLAPAAWTGWATLTVNTLGSFLLGLVAGLVGGMPWDGHLPVWHTALTAGLLGGFTTFSTASFECAELRGDSVASLIRALGAASMIAAAAIGAALLGWVVGGGIGATG